MVEIVGRVIIAKVVWIFWMVRTVVFTSELPALRPLGLRASRPSSRERPGFRYPGLIAATGRGKGIKSGPDGSTVEV